MRSIADAAVRRTGEPASGETRRRIDWPGLFLCNADFLLMPHTLQDKVIVITGGSSGIGAATAIACAQAGMRVVISARRVEKLTQVADKINAQGGQVLSVPCDVDRDEDVAHLVEQAVQHFGRIDVAYANAGYGLYAASADVSDAALRAIFETNFFGTMRLIRQVMPILRKQGSGHIIICSSVASEVTLPMHGAYAATKAAQDMIGGAMRAELADEHIDVTTVHPTTTRSEFFDQVKTTAGQDPPGSFKSPLMDTPQHVAKCIVKAIRKPRPEVWPSFSFRLLVTLATLWPGFAAWALHRFYRRRYAESAQTKTRL